MKYYFLLIIIMVGMSCKEKKASQSQDLSKSQLQEMYIGTYTRAEGHVNGKAAGISYVQLEMESGVLSNQKTVAKVTNPSFLVKDSAGKYIYAVSELAQDGEKQGYVHAYKVIKPDSLVFIDKYSTNGRAPCHVLLDKSKTVVFVANYLDATVTVYKKLEDGRLSQSQVVHFEGSGLRPERQEAPHLHNVQVSTDNKKVFVADLGSDKIWIYDLDSQNASISAAEQPYVDLVPGSGPRHIAVKSSSTLFVINELNSTISVIKSDGKSFKIEQNISTLPEGFESGNACADLRIHPNGQFLYGSNRGHNSVVLYQIEDGDQLKMIDHYPSMGDAPRNFNITPDGEYLIITNQNTDNLAVYSINKESGELNFISEIRNVLTPVCLEWS